jgi:hypothetical protein
MSQHRTAAATTIFVLLTVGLAARQVQHSLAFENMDRKVEILEANAQRPPSQPQITDITQQELNAYIAEGGVDLPNGVEDVKADFRPAIVHATATVDFDTLAAGHAGGNPIFSALFSGTHDIEAQAQASGAHGEGMVMIDWVRLDGVAIPRAALEYLIHQYVQPKYPSAGMTTRFALPLRIDLAVVSQGKVTLTQR